MPKQVGTPDGSGTPILDILQEDAAPAIRVRHQGVSGNPIEVVKSDGTVLWAVDRTGFVSGALALLNVKSYGAKGDLKYVSDGAITSGAAVLSSAAGTFAATDIGKTIMVSGAGVAVTPTGTTATTTTTISAMSAITGIVPGMLVTGTGIPAGTTVAAILSATSIQLSATPTAANVGITLTISGTLSTTISAVTNATTVTLAANASTTVTAASYGYGTDDSTAIGLAVAAFNAGTANILYFPTGNYLDAGGRTLSVGGTVRGDGISTAGFSSTITLKPGANTDIFTVASKLVTFRDIGIDGNYLAQTAASRGIVINISAAFGRIADCFILNTNGDGVAFSGAGSTGWHVYSVEMRNNQGYGININASAFDNDFFSVNLGSSGKSGVRCTAADNTFTQLHSWGNGTLNTANDMQGVLLPSGVGTCRFTNCYFETNYQAGVRIPNSGSRGHTFTGCHFWKNQAQGCYAFTATNITYQGCHFWDNGQNGSANQNAAGLCNDTGSFWAVTGCNFYDDQGTKTQTFAYYEVSTANNNTVIGNNMPAAQHKTGSNTITGAANVPVAASMGTYNQV